MGRGSRKAGFFPGRYYSQAQARGLQQSKSAPFAPTERISHKTLFLLIKYLISAQSLFAIQAYGAATIWGILAVHEKRMFGFGLAAKRSNSRTVIEFRQTGTVLMKLWIVGALLISFTALISAPAMAAGCSTGCHLQTKKASPKNPGKFDYVFSCIDDSSGDEIISKVTAATDDEAKNLAKKKC